MTNSVRHNPERSRFELVVDDLVVGVADYRVQDGTWIFPHTEIAPTHRGRGLGAELVQQLTEQMHAAAAELHFEVAARIRDEVQDLKKELRQMMEATK